MVDDLQRQQQDVEEATAAARERARELDEAIADGEAIAAIHVKLMRVTRSLRALREERWELSRLDPSSPHLPSENLDDALDGEVERAGAGARRDA